MAESMRFIIYLLRAPCHWWAIWIALACFTPMQLSSEPVTAMPPITGRDMKLKSLDGMGNIQMILPT